MLKMRLVFYALVLITFAMVDSFTSFDAVIQESLASRNNQLGWVVSRKILGLCCDHITGMIIFPDHSQNNWQKNFFNTIFADSKPFYLFGKQANVALQKRQRFHDVYTIDPIYVSHKTFPASSVTIFMHEDVNLFELLTSLKRSVWWNSRAKFVLVGFDDSVCGQLHVLLDITWSFNILSVIFLCKNRKDKWAFYTYNPYSSSAPGFWTNVEEMRTDKKLTVLQHNIERIDNTLQAFDSSLCKTLYFDKSRNMHGFNLKTVVTPFSVPYDGHRVGCQRCVLPSMQLICDVLKSMNAIYTVKLTVWRGMLNASGQPGSSLNEVMSGNVDLALMDFLLREYWWIQTYPFAHSKVLILTPIHSKYDIDFFMLFKSSSWLFLALLIICTVLSLQYLLKSSFILSFLDFVRLFVSNATNRVPIGNFERICFILIIYLWLMVNIFIQSTFSADKIMTNKDKRIDSVEDLINSNFTIYGYSTYLDMIFDERLRQRYIVNGQNSNIERLLKNEKSACLLEDDKLKYYSLEKASIHISRDSLFERGITWFFREDSPLLSTVNSILSRFDQAGIANYYMKGDKFRHPTKKHTSSNEFYIASRVLIGGWILGLGVAIIEIIIKIIQRI